MRVYIFNQTFHWFIVGLTFPILILFVLGKGLDIFEASLVMSGYSVATIFLELPTGGLADAIGRKRVYLLSLGVMFTGYVLIVVADGFVLTLLAAAVLGAARALSSGTIEAWFIDEYNKTNPGGNLQHAIARAGTFFPLGIGLGSLLGGAVPTIASTYSSDVLGNPYALNFVIAAILVLLQMALTGLMVREVRHPADKRTVMDGVRATPRNIAVSVELGLRNPVTRLLIFALMVLGFAIFSVELLWQPRVTEILGGANSSWVLGMLAAAYFLATSIGNLASPAICRSFKESYASVLLLSRILVAATLISLAFQQGIWGFAAIYIILYFLIGIEESPHSTLFNLQVPSQHRSTLISFNSLMLQLGGVIGSITLGWIANTYSIPITWEVAGVVLGLSSLAYLLLIPRLRKGASGTSHMAGH